MVHIFKHCFQKVPKYVLLMLVLPLGWAPVSCLALDSVQNGGLETEARTKLMAMAESLGKAPSFSVTIESNYDAIQKDGQRISFGERRKVLLQRPDRLRVDVERSDGDRSLIVFDGRMLTAYKEDENVYAQVERAGTVDEIVVFLVRNLQVTLPLARMLVTSFPQDLDKKVISAAYVEENLLFDVPTDHLAARSTEVDLQVWMTQGKHPLPRRVILTYMTAEGQPQFRADLYDWQLFPSMPSEPFVFTPPANAEQVPLLAPARKRLRLSDQKGVQP